MSYWTFHDWSKTEQNWVAGNAATALFTPQWKRSTRGSSDAVSRKNQGMSNKSLAVSFFRNDTCDPQKKHMTCIFQFIMKILQTFFFGWNSYLFVFRLFPCLEMASGQGYLNSLWVTISKWYQLDTFSLKWYEASCSLFYVTWRFLSLALSRPSLSSLLSFPSFTSTASSSYNGVGGVFITRLRCKFLAVNQVWWFMLVFPELLKMTQKTIIPSTWVI